MKITIMLIRIRRKWAYYITQNMEQWEALWELERELKEKYNEGANK